MENVSNSILGRIMVNWKFIGLFMQIILSSAIKERTLPKCNFIKYDIPFLDKLTKREKKSFANML